MKYSELYWEDVEKTLPHIPSLEQIYGKSILVTGATGMICSAVIDILFYLNRKNNAGITVILAGRSSERIAKRFSGFSENKDYIFRYYDATTGTPPDTKGISVDYVIHGASNAHPANFAKQPVETVLANIVGLNALLDLAVKEKYRRVLYISSSEVYGRNEETRPYREEDYGFVDILNPRASYPSAKRTAETLCASYGQEYDLDTVIVRPGHIYGPTITESDSRASAQFTWNAVRHEDIVMKSAGSQLRSYCYVLDCASAILAVLLCGERGNAYNISNSSSVITVREMAAGIASAAGVKLIFEKASDAEKKGYNLMDTSALNAEKLESLGWSACFDMEAGIKHMLDIL